jgi:hypothetical protein
MEGSSSALKIYKIPSYNLRKNLERDTQQMIIPMIRSYNGPETEILDMTEISRIAHPDMK